MKDILFISFIFALGGFWVWSRVRRQSLGSGFIIFYSILWIYHFAFGFYFNHFIDEFGGDSIGYWQQTADTSRVGDTWMAYFGMGNFFMQWLNYLPYQILGISFMTGTLVYNLISFLGISLIFEKSLSLFRSSSSLDSSLLYLVIPLFLPGLHFWTAGVSKEAILILCFGLVFYFIDVEKKQSLFYLALAVGIAFLVRPIAGLILALPVLYSLITHVANKTWQRVGVVFLAGTVCVFGGLHLKKITHISGWSWDALQKFSNSQFEFLDGFQAGSWVDMQSMSYLKRYWTILFEPLPWAAWDFHSLVFSFENLVLLLGLAMGLFLMIKFRLSIPVSLVQMLFSVIIMYMVFTFTLNNFGIIYRMKSIGLPFLYIYSAWLICTGMIQANTKKSKHT